MIQQLQSWVYIFSGNEITISKRYLYFISVALFTIDRTWKQPKYCKELKEQKGVIAKNFSKSCYYGLITFDIFLKRERLKKFKSKIFVRGNAWLLN